MKRNIELLVIFTIFFIATLKIYTQNFKERVYYTTIHCDPSDYTKFHILEFIVNKANQYHTPLTIQLSPQWVDEILKDNYKINKIHQWHNEGHEIAIHHHDIYHVEWDGFTNFPLDSVLKYQNFKNYLGPMDTFFASFEKLMDTIPLITMGSGPGNYPEVDWYPKANYYTDGTNQNKDAFSNPEKLNIGNYEVCTLRYKYVQNESAVHNVIAAEGFRDEKVIGVVTHPFDVELNKNFLLVWFKHISGKSSKTVNGILKPACYFSMPIKKLEKNGMETVTDYLKIEGEQYMAEVTVVDIWGRKYGTEIFEISSTRSDVNEYINQYLPSGIYIVTFCFPENPELNYTCQIYH